MTSPYTVLHSSKSICIYRMEIASIAASLSKKQHSLGVYEKRILEAQSKSTNCLNELGYSIEKYDPKSLSEVVKNKPGLSNALKEADGYSKRFDTTLDEQVVIVSHLLEKLTEMFKDYDKSYLETVKNQVKTDKQLLYTLAATFDLLSKVIPDTYREDNSLVNILNSYYKYA